MRRRLLYVLSALLAATLTLTTVEWSYFTQNQEKKEISKLRERLDDHIRNHPYSRSVSEMESMLELPKMDRPDLAMEQNYLMMIDPNTLDVPYERMMQAHQYTQQKLSSTGANSSAIFQGGTLQAPSNNFGFRNTEDNAEFQNLDAMGAITVGGNEPVWKERGPDNVGGRTRAILWDPNDPTDRRVIAAGVAGGIWTNDNILDPNSSWRAVNDFLGNLAVTTIDYDPNDPQVMYVGTGEGWFNADAVRGVGIFKSVDGGDTWTYLTSTDTDGFKYVQKIVVTSAGTVLAATRDSEPGVDNGGVFRSTDGGTSWTRVLTARGADLAIGANGDIYASRGIFSVGSVDRSEDDGVTWTDITPPGGANPNRIELATAPSNANVIYAMAHNGSTNGIDYVQRSDNRGDTWTDLPIPTHNDGCAANPTEITRGQAWYDLILAVAPNDEDVVLAGGVDIARTDDGGATWTQVSEWFDCSGIENVHADIHEMVWRPDNPNEFLVGTDGGIYYSPNAAIATAPNFFVRNKNFGVTQFYAAATDNVSGSDYFIAGAQDNGTQQFRSDLNASTVEVIGGDGAFCHVDQLDRTYQIGSSQFGNARHSTNGGQSFGALNNLRNGNFINQTDYDNTQGILYSAGAANSYNRISGLKTTSPGGEEAVSISAGGAQLSAIRANTNTANRIIVGTEGGLVIMIDNAHDTPSETDITPPSGVGTVSSVDVGATDDVIMVTYSNFGVASVWYTNDGGTTWIDKDEAGHGLPDLPVRWVLMNPNNNSQVMLATDLGVWSTNDVTAANPDWAPTNAGLANVRCDMLQYREVDGLVLVATHGRGLYTTDIFSTAVDADGPEAVSFTPGDDEAAAAPLGLNLEIEFDEPIAVGTGNVTLKLTADNSTVETVDVTSDAVTVTGVRAIISLTSDLSANTGYYVEVSAGAFQDNFGNGFAGIAATDVWNFTSFDGDEPPVVNVPVPDQEIDENSAATVIDVSNVFSDIDNDNASIVVALESNTIGAFATVALNAGEITITPLADKIGLGQVVISGTSNGKSVEDAFNVTVVSTAESLFEPTAVSAGNGQLEGNYNDGYNQNVDDFTVPGGQDWIVSTVTTQAFSLGEADLDMQEVEVTFYNDDNGAPGTVFDTQTITANNGQTIGGSTQSPSLNVRLNTEVTLTTGTYWVSILPTFNVNIGQDASTALYAWFQSANVGNSFDRNDPAGDYVADDNEMLFTIDGTRDISDFLPEVNEEIADIETSQDASPILVDLTNTFTDPDDDDNAITIEVTSNSNDALITTSFNNSRELVLTLAPGESGVADITLTATSNGLTVDESFSVLVIPVFSTYPYAESFDNDEGAFPVGWENQFITNFDWFVNTGGTPSGGTGPLGDNTTGSGFYVYAEATPIIDDGDIDTASVISPIFDFTALTTPELRFAYHMFGAGIGTLNVNVIPVGTTDTTNVFTISGQQQTDQGDPYINAFVSLGAFAGQTVRLEFVAINGLEGDGTSFRNDIAFDDVVIIEQPNNDLSVVSITPTDGDFVTGLSDVTAVFRNDGVNAQASFDAELSLNGNLLATETVTPTVPLERGEEFSYTFTQQVDIVQAGSNEITVNALLVGDDIPENNELSVVVVSGNTPFIGEYTMVQLTGGISGGLGGNGTVFSATGVDLLTLGFVDDGVRSFQAVYLQNLGITAVSTYFFTLNEGTGDVVFLDGQTSSGIVTSLQLGTADTPGIFDPNDPSAFTLNIKEDINSAFGGPVDVSFQLFVNESPTAINLDSDNIDEGAPIGTVVGTLSGVDSNPNDFLSFEISGGADAASFALSGTQLLANEVFNATVQDTYEVDITVTDLTGAEFTDSFTITVNDVTLDTAPVLSVTSATENGFTIDFTDLAAVGITYAVDISTDGFETLLVEEDGLTVSEFTIDNAEVISSNTEYSVRVRGELADIAEFGPYAEIAALTLPAAPVASEATLVEETSFTANWSSTDEATSFLIDVSADDFTTFVDGFEGLEVDGTSVEVDDLLAGTYSYRVTAENESGESALSNVIMVEVVGPLTIAPVVTASDVLSSGFTIDFDDLEGAETYEVDISADDFTTFIVQSTGITDSEFSIDNATLIGSNSAFNVRVRGVNSVTELSSPYGEVSVTTLPGAPVTTAATSVSLTSFVANWTSDDGATSFLLDVSSDDFTTFVTGFDGLAVNDATTATVSDLEEGTYSYRVTAVNATGESAVSNVTTVSIDGPLGLRDFAVGDLTIYPNPATDVFNVEVVTPLRSVEIEVLSILGKSLRSKTFENTSTISIDVSDLSSGTYFLKISDGVSTGYRQLVKK